MLSMIKNFDKHSGREYNRTKIALILYITRKKFCQLLFLKNKRFSERTLEYS